MQQFFLSIVRVPMHMCAHIPAYKIRVSFPGAAFK